MKKCLAVLLTICSHSVVCSQTVLKLTKQDGGYLVPCKVNGKDTLFFFDTGASDVSITSTYLKNALKVGTFKSSDILPGIVEYGLADGTTGTSRRINIRELRIGNLILENVLASVVEGQSAPMLLGQTALERFGAYTFNNATVTLTIQGNYKSDIDLALAAARKQWSEKRKNSGKTGDDPVLQQQIQQTKIDILRDRKIAAGLVFEVSKIDYNKKADGELTFKYDITNFSGSDYKRKALSQMSLFIDVYTKEGKVYTASVPASEMPAGSTVNGMDLHVKIRNYNPVFFRIYGVVNGPLLSTLED